MILYFSRVVPCFDPTGYCSVLFSGVVFTPEILRPASDLGSKLQLLVVLSFDVFTGQCSVVFRVLFGCEKENVFVFVRQVCEYRLRVFGCVRSWRGERTVRRSLQSLLTK